MSNTRWSDNFTNCLRNKGFIAIYCFIFIQRCLLKKAYLQKYGVIYNMMAKSYKNIISNIFDLKIFKSFLRFYPFRLKIDISIIVTSLWKYTMYICLYVNTYGLVCILYVSMFSLKLEHICHTDIIFQINLSF